MTHVQRNFAGHTRDLFNGTDNLLRSLLLIICGGTDALYQASHLFGDDTDCIEGYTSLRDQLGLLHRFKSILFDAVRNCGGLALNCPYVGSYFLGRLRAIHRQRPYFLRDDHKAVPLLTRSCCLYRGIERYQVHACRQIGDSQYRLVDFLTTLAQPFHDTRGEKRRFTHLAHALNRAVNGTLPVNRDIHGLEDNTRYFRSPARQPRPGFRYFTAALRNVSDL